MDAADGRFRNQLMPAKPSQVGVSQLRWWRSLIDAGADRHFDRDMA